MYNGVGVSTARGTGTSGYVQRNLSAVKPAISNSMDWKVEHKAVARTAPEERDPWLAEHKAERTIEVQLLRLRHELEGQSLDQHEIESTIMNERHRLREALASGQFEMFSEETLRQAAWEAKAAVAFGTEAR